MKTVVVTGGIGSGKSTVCAILSSLGVPVYDSDSRTKALYDTEPSLLEEIEDKFAALGVNETVRKEDGSLDRKALSKLIFGSDTLLSALESLVHPAVLEDFKEWKKEKEEVRWEGPGDVPFVVLESAIIMEKPLLKGLADKVVEVKAPRSLRLERVSRRDGFSIAEVEKRMGSQSDVPRKADAVIVNDSTLDSLISSVSRVFSTLWQ